MAVPFDTLARKLEDAGFDQKQAQGAASALAEVMNDEIATRRDFDEFRTEIRRDLNDLRKEVAQRFGGLERQMAELEQRLDAKVHGQLQTLKSELVKWVVGLLLGQTAVVPALVRLL